MTVIYEDSNNGAHAQLIERNDLWDIDGTTTTLYFAYDPAVYDDITNVNSLSWANNNVNMNTMLENIYGDDMFPETMEDNDWHLKAVSPVLYSARDLSSEFTTDKDDVTRTGNGTIGWSMGAYERD